MRKITRIARSTRGLRVGPGERFFYPMYPGTKKETVRRRRRCGVFFLICLTSSEKLFIPPTIKLTLDDYVEYG